MATAHYFTNATKENSKVLRNHYGSRNIYWINSPSIDTGKRGHLKQTKKFRSEICHFRRCLTQLSPGNRFRNVMGWNVVCQTRKCFVFVSAELKEIRETVRDGERWIKKKRRRGDTVHFIYKRFTWKVEETRIE